MAQVGGDMAISPDRLLGNLWMRFDQERHPLLRRRDQGRGVGVMPTYDPDDPILGYDKARLLQMIETRDAVIVKLRRIFEEKFKECWDLKKKAKLVERLMECNWFKMNKGQKDECTYLSDCWCTSVNPDFFDELRGAAGVVPEEQRTGEEPV